MACITLIMIISSNARERDADAKGRQASSPLADSKTAMLFERVGAVWVTLTSLQCNMRCTGKTVCGFDFACGLGLR
eukprot:1549149-Amphidinium_carterae.2